MAEVNDSKDQGTSGGLGETVSQTVGQGVEYLQSVVTGTGSGAESGSGQTGDKIADGKVDGESTASASGIHDGHVAEMLRDKYKSKPEDGDEQKDNQ